MAGTHVADDDPFVDTDVFVVIENENEYYDFVTIDEDASYDAIVIDMSQDELPNTFTVTFEEEDASTGSFVTIDEDQVFVSDFTADDFDSL